MFGTYTMSRHQARFLGWENRGSDVEWGNASGVCYFLWVPLSLIFLISKIRVDYTPMGSWGKLNELKSAWHREGRKWKFFCCAPGASYVCYISMTKMRQMCVWAADFLSFRLGLGNLSPHSTKTLTYTLHFNMPSTVEVNNNCYNKVMWMCCPSKYFGFALFVVLRQGLVQTGLKLQLFYLCLLSAGSVTQTHTRACMHTHTFSKAFTVLSLLVQLWNDTDLVMAWSKALSLVPGPDCVAWGTATKLTFSFFFLAVSQIESFLTKILAMQPMIFFFLLNQELSLKQYGLSLPLPLGPLVSKWGLPEQKGFATGTVFDNLDCQVTSRQVTHAAWIC